jgi:hypothetical protein
MPVPSRLWVRGDRCSLAALDDEIDNMVQLADLEAYADALANRPEGVPGFRGTTGRSP